MTPPDQQYAGEGSPMLLRVEHLNIESGGRTLVSDVSFEVAAGERVGLVGESGSGKSVTSLAVTGLLPKELSVRGSIELAGVQTVGADETTLQRLRGPVASIVFQEPLTALDPLMRVGKQIAEPLRRHRGLRGAALREAVFEALAEVLLNDPRIARAYPHELSGGQRQRIAIAIALAAQPRLLIADEPTTALDVTVQAEVLSLLDRLVDARQMGLLFISHDLAVVSKMVDQALVLRQGEVVERGLIRSMLIDPQHPYTVQLVAHARSLDDALEAGGTPLKGPQND